MSLLSGRDPRKDKLSSNPSKISKLDGQSIPKLKLSPVDLADDLDTIYGDMHKGQHELERDIKRIINRRDSSVSRVHRNETFNNTNSTTQDFQTDSNATDYSDLDILIPNLKLSKDDIQNKHTVSH